MNAVDVINSFTIKYLKDRADNLSIKDANKQNPIYQIFRITFGLTSKEFDALAKNLRMAVVCNDYLKEINSDLYLFSYELLSKLKENLKSVGLDELTIKNLIIKSPIIILFSDKLDNVFFLYKADKFYGYTILVNNEYMTYMFNNNVQSNVITNNTMIDMMLSSVADAKKQEQLKVYFKHLERNYSLKNFYFKTIKDSKKDR